MLIAFHFLLEWILLKDIKGKKASFLTLKIFLLDGKIGHTHKNYRRFSINTRVCDLLAWNVMLERSFNIVMQLLSKWDSLFFSFQLPQSGIFRVSPHMLSKLPALCGGRLSEGSFKCEQFAYKVSLNFAKEKQKVFLNCWLSLLYYMGNQIIVNSVLN